MREQKRTGRTAPTGDQRYDMAIDRFRRSLASDKAQPSKYSSYGGVSYSAWSSYQEYRDSHTKWRRIYAGGIVTISAIAIAATVIATAIYIGVTGVIRWLP